MNEELFRYFFSNAVNQSIYNRENRWQQLPDDQQKALDKILQAIHDIQENKGKIRPEYQAQAFDAIVLKIASEMGRTMGGTR